jgi:MFS family permease
MLVALGAFMTTLDSSIVNIALPAIAHNFGVGVSGTIEWIIIGYLIVIAACLLTLGRLADMIGRKPIYEAGLVIFVLGSIFSGAAPSLAILIIARLFQGVAFRGRVFVSLPARLPPLRFQEANWARRTPATVPSARGLPSRAPHKW